MKQQSLSENLDFLLLQAKRRSTMRKQNLRLKEQIKKILNGRLAKIKNSRPSEKKEQIKQKKGNNMSKFTFGLIVFAATALVLGTFIGLTLGVAFNVASLIGF